MNDRDIRNTLVTYLIERFDEVRIYQGKSIGSIVCDVMAVTDKLIGYKIKSDADNNQWFERQIEYKDKIL